MVRYIDFGKLNEIHFSSISNLAYYCQKLKGKVL